MSAFDASLLVRRLGGPHAFSLLNIIGEFSGPVLLRTIYCQGSSLLLRQIAGLLTQGTRFLSPILPAIMWSRMDDEYLAPTRGTQTRQSKVKKRGEGNGISKLREVRSIKLLFARQQTVPAAQWNYNNPSDMIRSWRASIGNGVLPLTLLRPTAPAS